MSTTNKTYLDLAGLTSYDGKIKEWANSTAQKGYKTVKISSDGNYLYFYKKANAVLGTDTPDETITLSGGDVLTKLDALATAAGATWDATTSTYSCSFASSISATTIVGAINEVISDFNTFIGEIPSGATATTVVGYAAEVAAAEADAAETAANGYTDIAIAALDADVDASGTAAHSGTFVVSGITEVDGVITAVDSVEVEAAGAAAAAVAALDVNEFALASESGGVVTIKGIKEVDGKIAIGDGAGISLGTAAKADKATTAIVEESTDTSLVSAEQVATFVAAEIAGLTGAMHFRGVITRQTGETDAEAIARVITSPASGDVVVMSDNAKEYVYDGTSWREVGDETEFVKKTTTIAGVDLEDNITKTELLTALNVADGAQVNVLEGVQVNSSDLTIDANKKVNVTVAEGSTNGTVAVNGSDIAVHGLGSAAYTASTAYDAAGTAAAAVAALDTSSDVAIATYAAGSAGSADIITLTGAMAETDGIISGVSTDNITLSTITSAEINALFT